MTAESIGKATLAFIMSKAGHLDYIMIKRRGVEARGNWNQCQTDKAAAFIVGNPAYLETISGIHSSNMEGTSANV
jgi:hypothetical protein